MRGVQDEQLVLEPVGGSLEGEPVAVFALKGDGPWVAGRSAESDWTILDHAVSRRHAEFACTGGVWTVRDLGSSHGTSLNGQRLGDKEVAELVAGDVLSFGTWSCRCRDENDASDPGPIGASDVLGTQVSVVPRELMAGLAQVRLDALLTVSRSFHGAQTLEQVGAAAVQAVRSATGCERVVMLRETEGGELGELGGVGVGTRVSGSLIDRARDSGGLVELRVSGSANQAHSIMDLGIRAAICAPVMVNRDAGAFLYLDTRNTESHLPQDASAFCQAVAELAGMALERVIHAELAARHAQLAQDLNAARRAQELLMPARAGRIGAFTYAYESLAGRVVAGDLFDVFALDEDRVAVLLGDVSGKGVGAAVLMAAAQSQMRMQMLSGRSLGEAVAAVNRDLWARTEASKFVTMIAVVLDAGVGTIEVVDAGHGFGLVQSAGGEAVRLDSGGGYPLGVVEDAEYEARTLEFSAGSRLVLFSDGVAEQADEDGRQFGFSEAVGVVGSTGETSQVPQELVRAVQAHADGELDDDLTVAAIGLPGG